MAEAPYRTPSAVSHQLRTAEREFGVSLVEPVGRGPRLTAEGQLLARGADEVGAAIARVQARLEEARGEPGGAVLIGVCPPRGPPCCPLS